MSALLKQKNGDAGSTNSQEAKIRKYTHKIHKYKCRGQLALSIMIQPAQARRAADTITKSTNADEAMDDTRTHRVTRSRGKARIKFQGLCMRLMT